MITYRVSCAKIFPQNFLLWGEYLSQYITKFGCTDWPNLVFKKNFDPQHIFSLSRLGESTARSSFRRSTLWQIFVSWIELKKFTSHVLFALQLERSVPNSNKKNYFSFCKPPRTSKICCFDSGNKTALFVADKANSTTRQP